MTYNVFGGTLNLAQSINGHIIRMYKMLHVNHQNVQNAACEISLAAEQSAQTLLPGTDRIVCITVAFATVADRS